MSMSHNCLFDFLETDEILYGKLIEQAAYSLKERLRRRGYAVTRYMAPIIPPDVARAFRYFFIARDPLGLEYGAASVIVHLKHEALGVQLAFTLSVPDPDTGSFPGVDSRVIPAAHTEILRLLGEPVDPGQLEHLCLQLDRLLAPAWPQHWAPAVRSLRAAAP